MVMETAIGQIAECAQRQDSVIASSRASIQGLMDEVNIHRIIFQKSMDDQADPRSIHREECVVTQEMAQYINALIQDNQNENMRMESMVKELQAQAEILRQQRVGQEVIAEMMKRMLAGYHQGRQQPQRQGLPGQVSS